MGRLSAAPGRLPAYAVVSPVKDEVEYLPRTAASLAAQTHRPTEWVIVDDGSSDGTVQEARRWAERYDWITVVESPGEGQRARGAPIVRAFKRGLAVVRAEHEFVVKLDGDLYLAPHYFEWVAATFARDPSAGIVGGLVLVPGGGEWDFDAVSRRTVNGVAKAYRVACLHDMGGLPESMGWDGIDEYAARARGWRVHVLTELSILHYKPRGSKQKWWRSRWEEGTGAHFMGYLPSAVMLRAGYRMLVERPRVLSGLVLAAGYLTALASRRPVLPDPSAREELRREQRERWRGLLRGRREVPPRPLEDGGPAYWPETSERDPSRPG